VRDKPGCYKVVLVLVYVYPHLVQMILNVSLQHTTVLDVPCMKKEIGFVGCHDVTVTKKTQTV
jgi:hypothetical protein